MTIKVTKVSEGMFIVTETPPHVRQAWSTTESLSPHELSKELSKRGAHPVDIADAFYFADREFVK
jgi:hypothetical protein